MLGGNTSLYHHTRKLAFDSWMMQREAFRYPTCNIISKEKDSNLPSYLDNKIVERIQERIPVLPKQIKYRDAQGRYRVSQDYSFIFHIDCTVHFTLDKDFIIEFQGYRYTIVEMAEENTTGLAEIVTTISS